MAHFNIISSQSGQAIFEGAPRYVGAYLKPGYLEFGQIGSPAPISWHVGDYVVYSRTGKTYRLYRTPQTVEQGARNRYGASFLYENVQFFDDSKQLEFCPFTDLVPGDNTIHFSTQNTVSFFGKPLNVAERVQACLEAQYGSGSWEIRIVTTSDADLLELLDTEVEFAVTGANCLEVLDKVYETWNGLGWVHSVENGVNVITIGASNVRTSANTTVPFAYDDGLVRVEKSIANADQIGTRLFAYGSMKNMDATYYRGLDIYNAESVDIEHLMIPLASWGKTSNKPDARKAYIENAEAIAQLGLIPRTAYFDGTGDLPDIHPTLERMTIGEVYDAGGAGYLPNLSKWSRSQRVDEIVSATNPDDHGTSAEQGQKYAESVSGTLVSVSETFVDHDYFNATIFSGTLQHGGKLTLKFGRNRQVFTLDSAWSPIFNLNLSVTAGEKTQAFPLDVVRVSSTSYYCVLPDSIVVSGTTAGSLMVSVTGYIGEEEDASSPGGEGVFSTDVTTTVGGGLEYELAKTFSVTIPQIGFDIDDYAALGEGKTISMKTGMCAGRDFEIKGATYVSSDDSWVLTLYRSIDEDLNIMFPNADYEIAAGDQYVLLDIAMPEMYVTVASQRLLSAAQTLLADISVERPFYAPQIDAKVVYNESRVLRDGMWMDISLDGDRQFVIIDSITIDENGSNIPTYEVALRESKGLEWTENVGRSSSGRSSSSVNGGDTQQANGSVTSVGLAAPTGMEVEGSPVTGAGVLKLKLASGYKIPLESELASYFEIGTPSTLVQLKSAYSYIGTRKGLVFDTEADPTNSPAHLMVINKGTAQNPNLALYSPLPLITGGDQIVIDGDPQGGGGGGGATMLRQLEDVYHNSTSVLRKNGGSVANGDLLSFDSAGNRWVALDQSTITPDLSNYYTKTQTDTEISSAISALNLGAAATYGVGSVASGNTGLVTGGSVYSAINEAVSSALKFQGITTTAISDGSTTNPITINNQSYTAKKGDVVLYDGKEYLWTGSAWEQLGDEASWALKTTTISAGTGLTGGGTLAANRTISLSDSTIASLALADSAYQKPSTGIPQTDLASALSTKIDNGSTAYGYFSNGILPYNHGGTGISSYTKGNIIYASANNTLAKLAPNTGTKQFLTMTSSVPSWDGVDETDVFGSSAIGSSSLPVYYTGSALATITSLDLLSKNTGYIKGNRFYLASDIYFEYDSDHGYVTLNAPFVTSGDQIVISGTPGGGGGGGATNLKELEDVYHNASGVRRYSSGNVGNTDLLGYDSTKGWYAVKLGTGLQMTNGELSATGTLSSVSLAAGATNGTLHLVVNGTAQSDVAVTGLGSLAYKSSLVASDIPDLSATYQPKDADLTAIAGLSGTSGFLKKTAANTWSLDTNTYLTGITSTMVTTALGYTPANSTALANYVLKSGDTMTGNLTMGANSVVFNASHSSTWANPQNSGLRILNTVGQSATGAPGNYHIGLSVSGYYGFQLACYGGTESNTLLFRNTSTGGATNEWVTIWHTGNLTLASLAGNTAIGSTSLPIYYTGSALAPITDLDILSQATGYVKANRVYLTSSVYFEYDPDHGYVTLNAPFVTSGDQIVISGTPGGGGGGGATNLWGLDDVNIPHDSTYPGNGDLLSYDLSTHKWVNVAASSVGGVTSVAGYTGAVTAAQISSAIGLSGYVTLAGTETISGLKTFTSGLRVSGRAYSGGDDEGIVIGWAANAYATISLGSHNAERSTFSIHQGEAPKWVYNNGTTGYTITHPAKTGTIALTSDIPNVPSWAMASTKPSYAFAEITNKITRANEFNFIPDAYDSYVYFNYRSSADTAVNVSKYIFHNGSATTSGRASVEASSFIKYGGTSAQFLKADGSVDSSTYLTGNQTITLSGDVSGSGTTSITTTIGEGKVTNAMLAGSIENSKLNTIGVAKGGTGLTTWTGAYRLVYSTAATTLTTLAPNSTTTRKFLRQVGANNAATAPAWDTVTKTDVGLSNVENTALSTWTGTSSITTLGTITTGVWHGSSIGNSYLANSSITINGSSTSLGGSFSTASITAGTAGQSGASTGVSFSIPYVTMNKYGIVTAYGTHTHTISANDLTTTIGETTYAAYHAAGYVKKDGDTMTGNLTMGANAVVFAQSASSSWENPRNSGLRILNVFGTTVTGAPRTYSVGLSVSGYYGFQIASYAGSADSFYIRGTGDGSTAHDWRTLWHSGNSNLSTVAWACSNLTASGTITSTGDQVISSDLTLKTNLKDVTYSVSDIAKARAVEFDWKDGRGHSMGSIAQDWLGIAPALVHGEEGNMSLAYGQLALVNTILLARQSESHEERIARLEARVAELEMENERLRMN